MFSSIFYSAKAEIKGGRDYPDINGVVLFRETRQGVLVTAKINGLPHSDDKCKSNRFFGFHIHERKLLHWK